jgi:hypothetical protein
MNKLWVLLVLGLALPAGAQTVALCEPGVVCWTDGSAGKATTTIKLSSAGGILSRTFAPGVLRWEFVTELKAAHPLFQSPWICAQGRHTYPDGKLSNWYLSETEGQCVQFVPPVIVPPPPPVEKPGEVNGVRVSGRLGTQVELTWEAVTGATSYTVKYIAGTGKLTEILKGLHGTSALVNLPASGRRYYVVCAVNAKGETCPAKLRGAFATR